MKQHRILSLAMALACIATSSLNMAYTASAAAPTPPRDAKKVVYSLKSGTVKLDIDDDEKVVPNQLKDFDAVATFINPSIAHWSYGFVMRRQTGKGALAFLVDNTGDAVLGRITDSFQFVKPIANLKSLKKNANDRNEIALYARGDQVLAFVNKVYVDTWTVADFIEAGELALVADSSDQGTNREIKFANFVVRTPPNTAPGAAVATPVGDKISKGNIEVALTNQVGYVAWGRPIGMSEPEKGCNSFNDGSPVQQAQISVQIKNKSNKVMKDFYLFAFKPGGAPAYVCYYNYDGAGNEIQAGQARNLTFAAFVENGEKIAYFFVADKELGVSNRVNLP